MRRMRLRVSDSTNFSPMWQRFILHVHGKLAEEEWDCWHLDNPVTLANLAGKIINDDGNITYVEFDTDSDMTFFMLRWG